MESPQSIAHAQTVMSTIFAQAGGNAISDIQIRSGYPVYCHTKQGLEVIKPLGELPASVVTSVIDFLYNRQEVDAYEGSKLQGSKTVQDRLLQDRVADFSSEGFELPDGTTTGRMRVQAHLSTSGPGVTCRILNNEIAKLNSLGIGDDTLDSIKEMITRRQGFGLVTGQTGSGKTTTMAALLDWLRQSHARHIVTIEDPIEYRYSRYMNKRDDQGRPVLAPGFCTQQEVGKHVRSYQQGLIDALRKAPHVILLGEIRSRETMETAIEASQTGHVVISTMHTNGTVKTLSRILEFFPQERHQTLLGRLSDVLMFILSQGLIPTEKGRVLNYEFLKNDSSPVRSGIAKYDNVTKSLEDSLKYSGCVEWDAQLKLLLNSGKISHQAYLMNRYNDEERDDLLFVPQKAS